MTTNCPGNCGNTAEREALRLIRLADPAWAHKMAVAARNIWPEGSSQRGWWGAVLAAIKEEKDQ